MGAIDSGNTAWILTSASLVFLMTPGVAFFYGGMVRAKAVLNMLMLEAAALSVTMIIWTLWGWSIAYAGSDIGGIFGDPASGFLLKDSMVAQDGVFTATGLNGNNYPVSVDVAFQVAFAMITVGLICGAIRACEVQHLDDLRGAVGYLRLRSYGPHGLERWSAVC